MAERDESWQNQGLRTHCLSGPEDASAGVLLRDSQEFLETLPSE
jgi:hypothetical protein